jgi:hypothetical protein
MNLTYITSLSTRSGRGLSLSVASACVGSGEGSDHFESYVHSLSLHFYKRLQENGILSRTNFEGTSIILFGTEGVNNKIGLRKIVIYTKVARLKNKESLIKVHMACMLTILPKPVTVA